MTVNNFKEINENMKTNSQKIQSLAFAASLASGVLLTSVAASAQTTAAPILTASANTTNVSMSSSVADAKVRRQAELESENAAARRVEFVHFGMSF
jgi:hypothetical protein